MTDTRKWMPVSEFVKLTNELEDAYQRGDADTIKRLNARLEEFGYTTFLREGKMWIENMRQTGRKLT